MSINDYMYKYFRAEGELASFEREVYNTYGDAVSIAQKAKTLAKFGSNSDVGTSLETIWTPGGNETYVTDNVIDTVSSSNAGDTQVCILEGHTVVGTGEDAQYTFVVQSVTLNGQNKVVLNIPLARVSRMYNNGSTNLVGDTYVYEDDTVVSGVPQTAAKLHLQIPAGQNQTFKAATTFSNTDYFCITATTVGVTRSSGNAAVDFFIDIREPGKVFRPRFITTCTNATGSIRINLNPYVIVPKNSDIRVRAVASTTNVPVNAEFGGYIAEVVS